MLRRVPELACLEGSEGSGAQLGTEARAFIQKGLHRSGKQTQSSLRISFGPPEFAFMTRRAGAGRCHWGAETTVESAVGHLALVQPWRGPPTRIRTKAHWGRVGALAGEGCVGLEDGPGTRQRAQQTKPLPAVACLAVEEKGGK